MNVSPTELPGVLVIVPAIYGDERGFFYESFNARQLVESAGITDRFVQDNHSRSSHMVLRGLHYQRLRPQGKLVRVTQGEVFDVAVDIRIDSPHFGKWTGVRLSAENRKQLWIPPGFAHGFLVLSDYAEVQYKTTDYWMPALERCLSWDDPALAIDWPLQANPVISARDRAGHSLAWLRENGDGEAIPTELAHKEAT